MARAIDAKEIEKKLSEWLGQPGNGDYYSGYDAALCAAQDLIADMPTLTTPNEPLTLDELREMDGEPVFVVIDDGIEPLKMWALVDYIAEEQCLTLTNNLGGRSQYYTADDLEIYHITAYRRPPEGEEENACRM